MRSLFLHIGQPYARNDELRACFSRNRLALLRAGIRFPRHLHPREVETTTSFAPVQSRFGTAAARWATARGMMGEDDVLVSSPFFLTRMGGPGFADELTAFARTAGFDRVSVLMVIREPFEHLAEMYLHDIRHAGSTQRFAEAGAVFDMPAQALRVMERHPEPLFDVRVVNYRNVADAEPKVIADWLGIEGDQLRAPKITTERALTAAEAMFQRALNAQYGSSADILINELYAATPDLLPDPPRLSSADAIALHERLRPAMAALNQQIDQAQAYDLSPPSPEACQQPAPTERGEVTVSREHLQQIAAHLAHKVRL